MAGRVNHRGTRVSARITPLVDPVESRLQTRSAGSANRGPAACRVWSHLPRTNGLQSHTHSDFGPQDTDDGLQGTDDGIQGTDDGLQDTDDGLQDTDDGLQGTDDGLQGTGDGLQDTDDGASEATSLYRSTPTARSGQLIYLQSTYHRASHMQISGRQAWLRTLPTKHKDHLSRGTQQFSFSDAPDRPW